MAQPGRGAWAGRHREPPLPTGPLLSPCWSPAAPLCPPGLQFVAKRAHSTGGVVHSADLAGVQVGQKDMTKGAFAVWQDLLQKRVRPNC